MMGYGVMELRKDGKRFVEFFFNRAHAYKVASAMRRHYPTRRFSVIEWKTLEFRP